jgi:hypothetical protein
MRMYIYMGDKTGPVTVEHQLQVFLFPEQFILSIVVKVLVCIVLALPDLAPSGSMGHGSLLHLWHL